MPSPGYRVSGKEVEVRGSGSRHHQLCGCCNLQLIQSHVAPSHGPPARALPPHFFPAKSLLLPKPRGKKKHSKTTRSSLLSLRTLWSFSPFQNHVVLFLSPQNLVFLSIYFRTMWPPIYFRAARSAPYLLWSRVVYSFLPQNLVVLPLLWLPHLGLNPRAHLPLEPHFRLLLQSVTPASIPVSSSFTGLP